MTNSNDMKKLIQFYSELPTYKYVRKAIDRSDERRLRLDRIFYDGLDWVDDPGIGYFTPTLKKTEVGTESSGGLPLREWEEDLPQEIGKEQYGLFIEFGRSRSRYKSGRHHFWGRTSINIKTYESGVRAATPEEIAKLMRQNHRGLDVKEARSDFKSLLERLG